MSIDSNIVQNISIKFSKAAVYHIITELFQKILEEARSNQTIFLDDEIEKLNQRQGNIFLFYYDRNSVW